MHIRRFTDGGGQWKTTSLSVVVGAYDITHVDDRWSRRHQVREVVIHELFEHVTYHNDIALIRVSPAVEFNDKIGPICVDSSALPADPECFVTGWGDTDADGRLYTATLTLLFPPSWLYVCLCLIVCYHDNSEICNDKWVIYFFYSLILFTYLLIYLLL